MVTNKASARFRRHPSPGHILTILNGSATGRKAREVRDHVESCSRCSKFAQESRALLAEISGCTPMDDRGAPINESHSSRIGWVLHRRWASAMAIGTAFFLAASVPDGIPRVRADQLLAQAEGAQQTRFGKTPQLNQFYRAKMGSSDTTCQIAPAGWQLVAGHAKSTCDEMRRTLLGTNWNADDPLSVRWYRKWHDSLANRQDSLVRGELYSVVRTQTSHGAIAAASLRVFSSDYRPVELRLELADSRAISVEAYNSPSPEVSAPVDTATAGTKLLDANQRSRLDRTEVRAWQVVHEVGADSGWEAAITRTPKSVVVISSIIDVHRREQMRDRLQTNSEPNLEVHDVAATHLPVLSIWPQRSVSGDSIPLAEGILEARFSDASERSQFVTNVSGVSKRVVGLAFEHDRLRERRAALRSCPCSADLDPLLRDTRARLAKELHTQGELLSEVLGPLPPSMSTRPLSYPEAREMDAALESLFSAARDASREQRDALIQTVRRLVSRRQSSL